MTNKIGTVEKWKPVVGYEGLYEVSDNGNVRGCDRLRSDGRHSIKSKIRKASVRNGYKIVLLCKGGIKTCFTVHKLVAEAFFGKQPGKQVNHKDGNKFNNTLDNLEWTTPRENTQHAYANGLVKHYKGESSPNAKLNDELVKQARLEYVPRKVTGAILANRYGVNKGTLMDAIKRRTWVHI